MMPLARRALEVTKVIRPFRTLSVVVCTSANEPLQKAPVSAIVRNWVALPLISVRMLAMLLE